MTRPACWSCRTLAATPMKPRKTISGAAWTALALRLSSVVSKGFKRMGGCPSRGVGQASAEALPRK